MANILLEGMCAGPEHSLVCSPSNGATVENLMSEFNKFAELAPVILGHEDLLSLALEIQSQLLPPLLVVGATLFFACTVSFFLWKLNIKMLDDEVVDEAAEFKHLGRKRGLKIATLSLAWISLATTVASAASVTMAGFALQFNFSDLMTSDISVSLSQALMGLEWTIVALSILFNSAITAILCKSDGSDDIESKPAFKRNPPPPRSAPSLGFARPPPAYGAPKPPPPPPPPPPGQ